MKNKLPLLFVLCLATIVNAQIPILPIPKLVSELKKSVLLIKAVDTKTNTEFFGTGVFLHDNNDPSMIYILTCEHVISIKDTLNKTIGYYKDIVGFINTKNKYNYPLPLRLIYADEIEDFAILGIYDAPSLKNTYDSNLVHMRLQRSLWGKLSDINEGDYVLYIGFPLSLGERKRNYPLSRFGIVSQIIQDENSIMLDGFSQPGYSGSPVFSFTQSLSSNFTSEIKYSLIGIVKSYPNEKNNIYKVKLQKQDSMITITNPGFTYITPMDEIIKAFDTVIKKEIEKTKKK